MAYAPSGSALFYGFEDGTNGSAYVINTPADGGSAIADNTHPAHGSLATKVTGSGSYQYSQVNLASAVTTIYSRYYIYSDTALTGDHDDFRYGNSTTVTTAANRSLIMRRQGTNHLRLVDNAVATIWTSAAALAINTLYRVEMWVVCGASANATVKGAYYAGDSTTAIETFNITTATTTSNINCVRLGKQVSTAESPSTVITWYDDLAIDPAPTTFAVWPYVATALPPVAAFSSTSIGTDGLFTDASTFTSPATAIGSWAWDFGDGGTSTLQNPTHQYASAGTYTVGLTVIDNAGTPQTSTQTTHTITITAPPTSNTYSAINVSTGWTPTSGTVLSVLTDTSSGAPVLTTFATATSPTALALEGQLGPLTAPAAGQPLVVTVYGDRLGASSGSVAAQLFEGATQRSALTGILIPDMTASGGSGSGTAGTVAGAFELVFPTSDITSVVDWNQLVLKMQVTAA